MAFTRHKTDIEKGNCATPRLVCIFDYAESDYDVNFSHTPTDQLSKCILKYPCIKFQGQRK